ncbi:MAG: hypothetical protein MUF71_15325 [Candidatus Kapabacteria bacterium]|jgi:hypothetical protein|nr:hypothetical protein [Candidatus Kapabacteria bacterium]
MLITAMFLILCGILAVLRSGALSGRALSPEDFFNEGGFMLVVRHIFTHNPFSGYKQDVRILIYGVSGLVMIIVGIGLSVYFAWLMYLDFSR